MQEVRKEIRLTRFEKPTVSAAKPVTNFQTGVISPAQLKAARGLLNWTRSECAQAARISPETVKNIEHGVFKPQEHTCINLINTFAAHSVEFIQMINLELSTASGVGLGRKVHVSGVILLTPAPTNEKPESDELEYGENFQGNIT